MSTESTTLPTPQWRALRLTSVVNKVQISRTQIYRLINQGKFPRQYHLSQRISVWDEAEIDAWLASKKVKS
jgi:prophage regulatory protein